MTVSPSIDRRTFVAATVAALAGPALGRRRAESVVLYSSIDDFLLRDIVEAFQAESGVAVKLVGDTEATKTTGLVQRLLAERANPRADVWWSSEPLGTIRLAQEGVLEPYTSTAEADLGGAWPAWLRATDKTWYGFALRARVIARNTGRVLPDQAPRRLDDLADPKWQGRIGMARPEFGTTRGHMAALVELCGDKPFTGWLRAIKANGVRLFDGNSAVVRGLRLGEIDVGLTDTDDALIAEKDNGWPVAICPEEPDTEQAFPPGGPGLCSRGNIPIAATVARVKGGPNPGPAARLIDFLLSEKTESTLASGPARFQALRESVKRRYPESNAAGGLTSDFVRSASRVEHAMRLCREVLG